jgi:crotonobetainyl-CoA:carnitine CoA-transferase CaiB-like acyl-CoA transferase
MARLQAVADRIATASVELGTRVEIDLDVALTGRAALLGLTRHGRVSAGGACQLFQASDGWVAVNLARPDDVAALPAALEDPDAANSPSDALHRYALGRGAAAVANRCQLLGIPAAAHASTRLYGSAVEQAWAVGEIRPVARRRRTVLDLSAMWAGPTCAQVLGWTGMHVVKVESTDRPDGARFGDARFYEWLHAGHESIALDLRDARGRDELRALVDEADVVIEASRPRALAQFGIHPAEVLRSRPGKTWISITGYGRDDDNASRVAFGDDAAVAGGLVAYDAAGDPVFCSDAIADPTVGLFAARDALESQLRGGGHLVEIEMARISARLAAPAATRSHKVARHGNDWVVSCGAEHQVVAAAREPALRRAC